MTDDRILSMTNGVADSMAQNMVSTGEAIVHFIVTERYDLATELAASLAAAGRKWQETRFELATDGEQ